MTDQLIKQRLVGVFVLVAVLVILLPIIVEPDGGEERFGDSFIPPRPEGFSVEIQSLRGSTGQVPLTEPRRIVDETTEAEPKAGDASKAPSAPTRSAKAASAGQGAVEAEPKVDRLTQARAWAVQVGSFEDAANALALRDRIRHRGLAAFAERRSEPAAGDRSREMVRVFVGPELSRERAEALRERLHDELELDGLVIEYR